MRHFSTAGLLTLLLLFGVFTEARAQTGNCEPALADANLDVNNVRARILNNGNLFWRGSPAVYEVPKGGGVSAIFASGIWLAGQVGGELRVAASRYGPYEFWAGPLDENGAPPTNCSEFDRIYKVSREDVIAYNGTGVATPDLQDWPTGLGAPTLAPMETDGLDNDNDGEIDEPGEMGLLDLTDQPLSARVDRVIDLGAGERPEILGDQMLWWIMNDRGNQHEDSGTPPIGLEVHASAFAFNTAGAIGNTTFYRYQIFYRGNQPLQNAYIGLFSDPDLGDFDDDYVGSDTTLGLGYVYNADNDDGQYGIPPAAGYDFFQGPLVPSPGDTAIVRGDTLVDQRVLKMTSFVYYNNGGGVNEDPGTGSDYYNYMRARWKDGRQITELGDGLTGSTIPTDFMFPGNPVTGEGWSELNADGRGNANSPADRRFVMSSGPFTIQPDDQQEIVFGIVWSRGSSNLGSVDQLKADDILAQQVFDINFELPAPPAAPDVAATPLDQQVILEWSYDPRDNNYLGSYTAVDPLLSEDVTDNDYVFEGFNVYQYDSPQDQEGDLLAVYDVANGITRVIEGEGLTFLTADGGDNGVQYFHSVDGLTNYQTYYFGVQAYAYNEASGQKVYPGPVARVEVIPTRTGAIDGGTILSEAAIEGAAAGTAEADVIATAQASGDGAVTADVVNPGTVTGNEYRVEFYEYCVDDGTGDAGKQSEEKADDVLDPRRLAAAKGSQAEICYTSYDIINVTTGATVFDGRAAVDATGAAPPQGQGVQVIDGLSFNVLGPAPGALEVGGTLGFVEVVGPGGIDPCGEGAVSTAGCDVFGGNFVYFSFNGDGTYVMYHGGDEGPEGSLGGFAPNDYEIRFTEEGGYGVYAFGSDDDINKHIAVPFEVWDIGITGIGNENDPSDDVRLIPVLFSEAENGGGEFAYGDAPDQVGVGDATNGTTDWIYAYYPAEESTYEEWSAIVEPNVQAAADGVWVDPEGAQWELIDFVRGRPIQRVFFVDATGDPTVTSPGVGSVQRFYTTKPNLPGDQFSLTTDSLGATKGNQQTAQEMLDQIGIVPNPYKGTSAYEVSQLTDQVRFTNLPDQANIRIYTLSGTLIRTLRKESPGLASFPWDLNTEEGLPIASGMYLIHVDVPGVGERVLKFGVITKEKKLNTF